MAVPGTWQALDKCLLKDYRKLGLKTGTRPRLSQVGLFTQPPNCSQQCVCVSWRVEKELLCVRLLLLTVYCLLVTARASNDCQITCH